MEIIITLLHFVFAFLLCLGLTRWWISIAKRNKLQGTDMNKYNKPLVAEAGGIAVVISITLALLFYIFFKTFVLKTATHLFEVSTLIITLLLACFIGFIDDILGWKKGLAGWKKILMTVPIAIPLMVINAGHATMSIPFIGAVNFGLFYPLLLVPLGIIGATNGFNLLAGYNGLEAGLGAIVFTALGIISLATNQLWLALICGILVLSLLAFLVFNRFPAKIFPGDSLTYPIGALLAAIAIFGNMEKAALILFVPFIIDGILVARSKFKAEAFGVPQKDGSLELRYPKIYDSTHIALKVLKKLKPSHKVYEQDIVKFIWGFEIILLILALLVYLI